MEAFFDLPAELHLIGFLLIAFLFLLSLGYYPKGRFSALTRRMRESEKTLQLQKLEQEEALAMTALQSKAYMICSNTSQHRRMWEAEPEFNTLGALIIFGRLRKENEELRQQVKAFIEKSNSEILQSKAKQLHEILLKDVRVNRQYLTEKINHLSINTENYQWN